MFFFHDSFSESSDYYIHGATKFLVFSSVSLSLTESPSSGVGQLLMTGIITAARINC